MSLDRFEGTLESQATSILLTPENGTLTVPDGSLLFAADFQRDGHDLLLVNDGAPTIRIVDYFLSDPPAAIHAPNGSQLAGDVVARLAGPLAPGQYAQAGASGRGGDPIGQVETIDGVATVQRADGTVETLDVGMKIFQNDVVETDAGGSVSLTFADGTIFTLSSASRMIIDNLIYDPSSTDDNSASFSLVQGSFVFIAGQVAKTGGMDVTTPSATMGIRGTTVLVRLETLFGATTTQCTLVRDANGEIGKIELRGPDGSLIQTIEVTDTRWEVTTEDGETFSVERTPVDENDDLALIADAVLAAESAAERYAATNTFVTLPSASGVPGENGPQVPGQSPSVGDVDNFDEPIIEDSDEGPGSGGNDGGGGFLEEAAPELPELEASDVVVQGQEDAGEEGGIGGTVSVDAEGDLTFEITSGPQNGTASIDDTGAFNYVPDENFNGTDSFTYSVTDAQGDQGTGTVIVEVAPVNDPPELEDTNASAPEDGILVGSLVASDVDGDPLTFTLLSGPSNGTLTLLEGGSYSYIPDENFEGEDSFEVQVEDEGGATDTATVFVDVIPINDTPVVTTPDGGDTGTIKEDGEDDTVSGELTASDPDLGDSLTWSGSQAGEYGDLVVQPSGEWTYTIDPEAADPLAEGQEVVETFEVTVEDSEGAAATTTVEILVTGTNDAPIIDAEASELSADISEDTEETVFTGQMVSEDIDVADEAIWSIVPDVENEAGDVTVFSLDSDTYSDGDTAFGAYGTFTISATGEWTYTLTESLDELNITDGDASATESFTVQVADGNGGTDTQVITINLLGDNDLPVVDPELSDVTGDIVEDGPLTTSGQLEAADVDGPAESLAWRLPSDGEGTPTQLVGSYGTLTITTAGVWTYTLTADVQSFAQDQTDQDVFTVEVFDGIGTTQQQVTVTVTGTNDDPVIDLELSDVTGDIVEDGPLTTSGQLEATDVDGPAESLVWRLPSDGEGTPTQLVGSYGTLTITTAGVWTYTLTADVQSFAQDQTDQDVFTVEVFDGIGTTQQQVTVTVTGTNDEPEFASIVSSGDVTELQDGSEASPLLETSGLIEIFDADSADILSVEVTPNGEDYFGTLTLPEDLGQFNPETGGVAAAFNWTFQVADEEIALLAEGQTAEQAYDITVTDALGASATETVTITITGTNDTPEFVSEPVLVELTDPLDNGGLFATGNFNVFDTDTNDTVTFSRGPVTVVLKDAEGNVIPDASGNEEGLQPVTLDRLENFTIYVGEDGTWEVNSAQLNMLTEGYTLELTTTITAMDDSGAENSSATQEFTVIFTGTNDVPEFRGIVVEGSINELPDGDEGEGTATLSTSGLVNVFDIDQSDVLDVSFVENGEAYFGTFSIPEDIGQFNLETTGVYASFNWTFEVSDADIEFLAEGQTIEQAYDITVTDAFGESTTETVTITFTGTNDAPVINASLSGLSADVPEGTEQTEFTGQMVSDDVDDSDGETWSLASEGEDPVVGTFGNFTISATGEWTYTLTESLEGLNVPDGEASATETFTVQVSDGNGGVDTQVITINLIGENDGPEFDAEASVVARTIVEDDTPDFVTGQLVATDVDGPTPTWTTQAGGTTVQGTYGMLAITAAGVWTYTLDPALSNGLGPDDLVDDSFTLKATDSNGAEITRVVTVSVQGTNDAPIIAPPGVEAEGTVTEDAEDDTTSGQLSATDPEGDTVFWGIQGSVEGTYGVLSIDSTGFWTYTLDNEAANSLTDGPSGGATETFTVTVTDTVGDPTPQTVDITINVNGNNDAPIVEDDLVIENLDGADVVDGTLIAEDPEGEAVGFAGLSSGAPVAADTTFSTANGTVSVSADGQFIYVPHEGFVGFDSFEYRTTDASGNFTDGTATIAVESDDGSGGDNPVDVSINANATEDTPAGSLLIDVNEVSAPRVNVVFALDRSGSVSEDDWDTTLDAVDAALNQLLLTFGSSDTQVTVGFTVFSGGATEVVFFDLNSPNGTAGDPRDGWAEELAALKNLNTSGATNWTAALNEANDFFDAQEEGASNFLFFVTDGEPTVDVSGWPAARDNVENASYGADGLELGVRIEAFGIGSAFTGSGGSAPSQGAVDNLNALDSDRLPEFEGGDPGPGPYYTALTDPSLLAGALTETPVFNPALVSLTVELDVSGDGLGPVQVADQTTRALIEDELDYVMAFAEIENLADQLGAENRFTIRAEYDLDGDGVSDLSLFSTELLGRADSAQNIPNATDAPIAFLAGSDLFFGSDDADTIASQAGNDLILGYGGNDTLNAGIGIDSVLAGDGDDLITIQDAPSTREGDTEGELMDGGSGQDTLTFEFANDIFENALTDLTIRDIETLDMSNGSETTMRLTLSDVINMSSDSNSILDGLGVGAVSDSLLILGDAGDNLFLEDGADGAWSLTAEDQDIGGGELVDIWQYTESGGAGAVLATLGVDAEMDVNPPLPVIG